MILQIKQKCSVRLTFSKGVHSFVIKFSDGRIYHERKGDFKDNALVNFIFADSYTILPTPLTSDIEPLFQREVKYTLPKPQRADLRALKLATNREIGNTPARIFRKTGQVETSKHFEKYPFQQQVFIMLHEIGHFFYRDEEKCDLFALYHYLNAGYNQSQAYYVIEMLSDNKQNAYRRKELMEHLTNHRKEQKI